MKKITILLFALMCVGVVCGQENKQVAVLQPKVIAGTISDNDKLIVVANMKKAFTQIDGYKAYNRMEQALMDAEAEFQRSGRVSDTQIKKVGNQTAAAFICTFTLSKEGNEIVVNSDIIDVMTGEYTNSDFIAIKDRNDRDDVLKQCENLAYSLLDAEKRTGSKGSSKSSGNRSNPSSGGGNRSNGASYNPDGIEMVYVEGTGSGVVSVKGFYIGKYEVTQVQWQAVMGNNPSNFKGSGNPVEMVSWNDVQEFIKKLNTLTGKNYRLPTEAEWEYAAREGKNNSNYEYSGNNSIGTVAWCNENSGRTTHPVGQKSPNALDIYDMSGNVWEWVQDCYDSSCSYRVLRGGSWNSSATYCRAVNRISYSPGNRSNDLGFRLVLP